MKSKPIKSTPKRITDDAELKKIKIKKSTECTGLFDSIKDIEQININDMKKI